MIFDFYPWKLEVDIDKTKELYIKNNYAIDKKTNGFFSITRCKSNEDRD